MVVSPACLPAPLRAVAGTVLFAVAALLSGCADMGDGMTSAFADPAKYALYDCRQLETERKNLATRQAELQGLMAKAQTGVGGAVVAEVAYRNEYIAVRGQAKNADEAWAANNCHATPPKPAATPAPAPTPGTSGQKPKSSNAMN
jgi:hypothetical protein